MLTIDDVETLVQWAHRMERPQLVRHLLHAQVRFPVDLTLEYLNQQSDERLRHILLALYLHSDKLPQAIAA